MRMNGKSGFTMIELITVISILLLLMGAITTSVTGARRRAMTQQAISEAQQLATCPNLSPLSSPSPPSLPSLTYCLWLPYTVSTSCSCFSDTPSPWPVDTPGFPHFLLSIHSHPLGLVLPQMLSLPPPEPP